MKLYQILHPISAEFFLAFSVFPYFFSNDLDLIIGSKLNGKLTTEQNYVSVPSANWAGRERDWGCPSTCVPGSLGNEGEDRWLCVLRSPCPPLTPGQHQESHLSGPDHDPFLWPETMSSIPSSSTAFSTAVLHVCSFTTNGCLMPSSFTPAKVPASPFTLQVSVLLGVLGLKGGQQTDGARPTVLDEGTRDDL